MKPLSLYLHIPFCVRKCQYCDFLSFPGTEKQIEDYLETLLCEIIMQAPFYKDYEVQTIFFGGGTPSLLDGQMMKKIMGCLYANFHISEYAEISMEMNPGTADYANLCAYKEAGINRLSIGLQSAHDDQLKVLGRIHTYEQFISTYEAACKAGFQNINVDLMSALPGQTWESYLCSLKKVLALKPRPTHISAYSLIVEEGTPFYDMELQGELNLPTEEEERRMYEGTLEVLKEHGYQRYEISNYALDGYACRHNMVYWRRGDYLGLGLGAASLVSNIRWANERDRILYKERIKKGQLVEEKEILSIKEQMEEFMFLGLRLVQGVKKEDFLRCFGVTMEQVYGKVIKKHVQNGLLLEDESVYLTAKGLDVSNYVMADFLL